MTAVIQLEANMFEKQCALYMMAKGIPVLTLDVLVDNMVKMFKTQRKYN